MVSDNASVSDDQSSDNRGSTVLRVYYCMCSISSTWTYVLTSDCQYGDKSTLCINVPDQPFQCYNRTVYDTCCRSCPEHEDTSFL